MAQNDEAVKRMSTNADDYIRTGRLNFVFALLFAVIGILVIKGGLEPNASLYRELLKEIGVALLTAALVDILLLGSFERFKANLAAPFIEAATLQRQRNESFSKLMDQVGKKLDQINEETFRIGVETDLKLIRSDLEVIHYAVDPVYRKIVDATRKDSAGEAG
jgi:hypothetical protein